MFCRRNALAGYAAAGITFIALAAPFAMGRIIMQRDAGDGNVSLPYVFSDNQGTQWRIYQYGQIQQTGNMPLYSQGAMLMINGNQPNPTRNSAKLDNKTGELVLEHLNSPGFDITRRILVDKESNVVRYVDIVKNTQGAEQAASIMVQTTLNYGVTTSQNVPDPRKKGQDVGWVALTGAGQAAGEVYAGKNSKLPMQIQYQQGNNVVSGTIQINIPAGKEVAIMHLHLTNSSQDGARKWIENIKESDLLKNVPRDIRRLIVNFPVSQGLPMDLEILRGDLLDVIELKSGDQLKGTIKEPEFDLTTFYGPATLPVDQVVAMLNVGQFRPRQLMVTSDGQIFGGTLKKETMDLQLSSGQITQVPISQISRVGYRKRPDEPEEWTFEKPMMLLRTGERIAIKPPALPLECQTRYGKLLLAPKQVAAILFQVENSGVHEIHLSDGSKFAGLMSADQFEMALDTPGVLPGAQTVHFPSSMVLRIQFGPKLPEPDDNAAEIHLSNDDLLVGTLTGQIKLDTAFDTIQISESEVRSMAHVHEGAPDVQVVLWDGTSLSGQVQDPELIFETAAGLTMKLPVSLLVDYSQPQPQPSKEMETRIKKLIADLTSEDWKQRDRAQAQLTGLGTVALSALKRLREGQPPEAQLRIDAIVKQLEQDRDKGARPGSNPPPASGARTNAVPQFQPLLNTLPE